MSKVLWLATALAALLLGMPVSAHPIGPHGPCPDGFTSTGTGMNCIRFDSQTNTNIFGHKMHLAENPDNSERGSGEEKAGISDSHYTTARDLVGHVAAPIRVFFTEQGMVDLWYALPGQGTFMAVLDPLDENEMLTLHPATGQAVSVVLADGVLQIRTTYADGKPYEIDVSIGGQVTILRW